MYFKKFDDKQSWRKRSHSRVAYLDLSDVVAVGAWCQCEIVQSKFQASRATASIRASDLQGLGEGGHPLSKEPMAARAGGSTDPPLTGRTDLSVDSIDSTDELTASQELASRRLAAGGQSAASGGGGTKALTAEQTKKAESKLSKMKTRLLFGTPMIFLFFGLVYLGHPYMVLLIVCIQVGLFRELVNVKYKPAKERSSANDVLP